MAQGKGFCSSREALLSPPAVHGPEVLADWKRNFGGDVIMTGRMPRDTMDSEVYVKTPRGHSGILVDPWSSSTWRKVWNNFHTPNKVTKDKIPRFQLEKHGRRISLHRTAGRQR